LNFKTTNTPVSVPSSFLGKFFPAPFLVAVALYCVLIFYLSSISTFPVASPFPYFDKLLHFCLFGGLAAVVALGMQRAGCGYSLGASFIVSFGFASLYGLSDEVHQLFVEGRRFEIGDMAANAAGAVAAALVMSFLYQRKSGKKRKEA
jgi:VanZ family protein